MLLVIAVLGAPMLVACIGLLGLHAWRQKSWPRLLPVIPIALLEGLTFWAGMVQMRNWRPIRISRAEVIGAYVSRGRTVVDRVALEPDGGFTRTKMSQGRTETQQGRWGIEPAIPGSYTRIKIDDVHPACLDEERGKIGALFCTGGLGSYSGAYFTRLDGRISLETGDEATNYRRE